MNRKPYILVEPFCGMAALSFALMGCAPPISWLGSKRGYTRVLMELLGLSRHHPPAAFIWSDVGPNVAALATLAGARGDARDVAGWLMSSGWSFKQNPDAGFNAQKALPSVWQKPDGTEEPRGCLTVEGLSARAQALRLPRAPEVAAIIRTWKDEEPRALWERLKAAGWPSLMPQEEGRWLGPCDVREVAGWLFAAAGGYRPGHPESGYNKDHCEARDKSHPCGANRALVDYLPEGVVALPSRWPRVAAYQGTATRLVEQLPGDLSGFFVYIDGPYHGDGSRKITGYKFGGCSREEQLAMAADCHRRGARVAMSESVPLAAELRALTGAEWWEVDITEHREGQARSFGFTREYVTLNAAPLHMRGTQQGLFGGAR